MTDLEKCSIESCRGAGPVCGSYVTTRLDQLCTSTSPTLPITSAHFSETQATLLCNNDDSTLELLQPGQERIYNLYADGNIDTSQTLITIDSYDFQAVSQEKSNTIDFYCKKCRLQQASYVCGPQASEVNILCVPTPLDLPYFEFEDCERYNSVSVKEDVAVFAHIDGMYCPQREHPHARYCREYAPVMADCGIKGNYEFCSGVLCFYDGETSKCGLVETDLYQQNSQAYDSLCDHSGGIMVQRELFFSKGIEPNKPLLYEKRALMACVNVGNQGGQRRRNSVYIISAVVSVGLAVVGLVLYVITASRKCFYRQVTFGPVRLQI